MHGMKLVYLNMFFTIQLVFDAGIDRSPIVGDFLSDCSPFTFTASMSADPAVWNGFEKAFIDRFPEGDADDDDSYEFVIDFLEHYEQGYWSHIAGIFSAANDVDQWSRYFVELGEYVKRMDASC